MGTENLVLNPAYSGGRPIEPVVTLSAEAECYAGAHGLTDSLAMMRSLVLARAESAGTVDINLVSDPEARGSSVICFSIRTEASVSDTLAFDKQLRDAMFEMIPADNRAYFAVRFDFA